MNMDHINELDFHFLDLQDLSDNDRHHLLNILTSKNINKTLKLPWDSIEKNNATCIPIEQIKVEPNHWYNAMAHSYTPQLITTTQVCTDWQTPVYNISTNGHISTFITPMTYAQTGYNCQDEIRDLSYSRGNGCRGVQAKDIKKESCNQILNPMSEMQSGYIGGEQKQFHPQVPVMYIYRDNSGSPQHQVPAQLYYTPPPIYSPTIQPHTNIQSHPTYAHQHPTGNRLMRQSQSVHSQPNQEYMKSHDKYIQNEYAAAKPAYIETDNKDTSGTNIATSANVNNSKSESCVEDMDNTANRESMNNTEEEEVNIKIKQDNISNINKNCNGIESNDMPCVNITKIDVQENADQETNILLHNDKAVHTVSQTVLKSDENEIQVDENTIAQDIQDKVADKTLSNSLVTTSDSLPVAHTIVPKVTWASILKKGNPSSKQSSLFVTPNVYDVIPLPTNTTNNQNAVPVQKIQTESVTTNYIPQIQNSSSEIQNTINGYRRNNILRNSSDESTISRMGEFLLRYQMAKQTVSLLPRGLTNRSNYCYINSILQALLACPPFYNLLMALPYPKGPCRNSLTPITNNMVKFAHEFTPLGETARLPRRDRILKRKEDTVTDIQSGAAFEPSYIYSMLKYSSTAGIFSVEGRQEDAEEFLSYLLNGINDEMLELMKTTRDAVNNAQNNVNQDHGEEEWKIMGPKNKGTITRCMEFAKTPLSDIFRGQLRSRISRAGEEATDNIQPFFTLQLDIEKAESVKSALDILVGKDPLEGMRCSKTKQQIEAWKQVTLEELPVILILHLKWFDYKLNGCSKILKSVEFPVDLKIDGKFLSSNAIKKLSPKQKQYKLFAVTYHDGKEASKGHYVTDAFHVGYGSWVRYDDSTLKGVSENNVLKPTPPRVPYLLYYRRCDTIGNNQLNNCRTR